MKFRVAGLCLWQMLLLLAVGSCGHAYIFLKLDAKFGIGGKSHLQGGIRDGIVAAFQQTAGVFNAQGIEVGVEGKAGFFSNTPGQMPLAVMGLLGQLGQRHLFTVMVMQIGYGLFYRGGVILGSGINHQVAVAVNQIIANAHKVGSVGAVFNQNGEFLVDGVNVGDVGTAVVGGNTAHCIPGKPGVFDSTQGGCPGGGR